MSRLHLLTFYNYSTTVVTLYLVLGNIFRPRGGINMQVLAVQPNLFNKTKVNFQTNSVKNNTNKSYIQNDNLVDFNYGKTLIKPNSLSFKGNVANVKISLSKKVSAAFKALKGDDQILLIGKDLTTAIKEMQESIGSFKTIISDINFIQDEKMVNTIALSKPKEGFDNLTNLGKIPLFIQQEANSKLHFLKRGETSYIIDKDFISIKNPSYGFKIDFHTDANIENLPDGTFQHFAFADAVKKGVSDTNLKNVKTLINKEKLTEKKIVTFADVGGQDEAISELTSKVLYPLLYPKFFGKNFGKTNGTILIGPPGTGKSLAAQALANEAKVNFFDVDGQLFRTHWYGESGHSIHDFYEELRANAPCIAFMDEAEAVYRLRGLNGNALADDDLNVHLREITKLQEDNIPVSLLAATNRPDLIDPAIIRRFRNQIEFTPLDTPEKCKDVFSKLSKGLNISEPNPDDFFKKLSDEKVSGDDIRDIIENAKMNSIIREGVIDKIKNGTFVDNEELPVNITIEDLEKAFKTQIKQKQLLAIYEDKGMAERKKLIEEEYKTRAKVQVELSEASTGKSQLGFHEKD